MIKNEELLKYCNIQSIIHFFEEIDHIPRKSGNEKEIVDYIEKFAKKRNLKFKRDNNNIIVEKLSNNNSNDYIAFQSHTDMVCEKITGSYHNFDTDPIELYVEGDFIKSKETSIGADNGIGVAIMLSILDLKEIQHPNLEMIFTSEEETILGGAKSIDFSDLKSKRIISLDAFSEDIINIGCASCVETKLIFKNSKENLDKLETYRISLSGFLGGHSGNDIGKNRGNPIIELSQILSNENNIYLNDIFGGNSVNAIPREATAIFSIKKKDIKENSVINKEVVANNIREKYKNENIILKIEKKETDKKAFDYENTKKVLKFIREFPNGELIKEPKENYTIMSANLGRIYSKDGALQIEYSIRSNEQIEINNLVKIINKLEKDTEFIKKDENAFPGYKQNKNSEFIKYMYNKYIKTFKKKPIIKEEHFLLECGYFSKKIEKLEYLSISPNIYDPHSPYEKVSLSSIEKIWDYILEILKEL